MLSRLQILILGIAVVGSFVIHQGVLASQRASIESHYAIIAHQEQVRDDVIVTAEELEDIRRCFDHKRKNESEDCARDFYTEYALAHGIEQAFAHLARLQEEHPDFLPSCHYISHGIGHAAVRLNKNDPYVAFSMMQSNPYYKNVATCGNGFFHGVIEEFAKEVTDREELATMLREVCGSEEIVNKGNCYHGIGHAAAIQTDYSTEDMLYVCENVTSRQHERFSCYTGAFMEYAQGMPKTVRVVDGVMQFDFCDTLGEEYQPACYLEHSSSFEAFSQERRNYVRNIGFCKQIENDLNRMACVKLFAIRAVRISRFSDVHAMCRNTSSRYERVMCTAVVADRIGASIDMTRSSDVYRTAVNDVCGTLSIFDERHCMHIVYREGERLFYTSNADLRFSTPSLLSSRQFLIPFSARL